MQHASADDEIRLDHVILPHLPDETKAQLQDVGFLGAYALLPSQYPCSRSKSAKDAPTGCLAKCRQPWEICFKTQVAVRAVLLTANEWEYFVSNGEDLSGDKSAAVNAWLRPHLQALKDKAHEEATLTEDLRKSVGPDYELAVSIMKERWTQVSLHLGNFLNSISLDL